MMTVFVYPLFLSPSRISNAYYFVDAFYITFSKHYKNCFFWCCRNRGYCGSGWQHDTAVLPSPLSISRQALPKGVWVYHPPWSTTKTLNTHINGTWIFMIIIITVAEIIMIDWFHHVHLLILLVMIIDGWIITQCWSTSAPYNWRNEKQVI